MTRCSICGQDTIGSCLCGFCINCLEEYGHEKCTEIMIEKEKGKNGNKNKE